MGKATSRLAFLVRFFPVTSGTFVVKKNLYHWDTEDHGGNLNKP